MNLTYEDVQNILLIIDSPCAELHLETSDFKLFVRKAGDSRSSASPFPEPSGPGDPLARVAATLGRPRHQPSVAPADSEGTWSRGRRRPGARSPLKRTRSSRPW